MNISEITRRVSRSISAENPTGEKGKAGMSTEGTGAFCARDLGQGWKVSPSINIESGKTAVIADIRDMGVIRHMWLTDSAPADRKMILRIYWDGADKPSVEVPLGDFFAMAAYQEYKQMTSAAVCVNPKRAFNCYWEMPFRTGARITVENLHHGNVTLYYYIDYTLEDVPAQAAYFHAQFRRTNPLPYKEVYTILDNIQGQGQYVGTYLFWGVNSNGWWGEGEVKFYLDGDTDFPTICGTGTEDYFCGSYNFDPGGRYQEFCTPYAGLNKVTKTDGLYNANLRFSLYRWHIPDPIYFAQDIRVTCQALGWRSVGRYLPLQDDISSVAFFYLRDVTDVSGTLPDTDGLEIN
ncbi:MAG: DUF2961 domain-containing protein [Oscillospiraceae bacterium]|jgi:hypothetical protein|nr:DUF2961 domain-containing protein [Oscillospiraceae bacterium]